MTARSPLAACLALLSLFAVVPASASDADGAWRALAALSGDWRLAEARTPAQQAFRIRYRLISRDTALVETFGDPARQVTETLYHRDGERLLATHYCAQGNQPRLRLRADAERRVLLFEFLDATNLQRTRDAHLVRLRFDFSDPRRLVREEVYAEDGREDASTLTLVRAD
ncbi:hypothetical protein [Luteimonas aquatica]|uniref:hypothetical protein n=1 Tax=Luteimonas aquatica TaxID=450364 RepID=UPI001F56B8A0|nr:hypothetical protein [Luteimonas aquatica]